MIHVYTYVYTITTVDREQKKRRLFVLRKCASYLEHLHGLINVIDSMCTNVPQEYLHAD